MADETKRVIDQTTDSSLAAGDYVIVDSESEGTRKFDLGAELTGIKQDLENAGMSENFKLALHNILEKVAYIDEDGQDYLDALDNALWPPTNLVSISAVFTQGQNVIYDTDSLDTLKQYLVVTAHYSDSTTEVLTTYTLIGTLTAGTSTITVSYGGKTDTFTVNVVSYWDYEWDASSETTPTYFDAYASNFTSYPDAMYAENFYLDFDYVGDCEILYVAKMVNTTTNTDRTPQISIRAAQGTSGYDGFKATYNTPSKKVETNLSGTFTATTIGYNDYHEYRAKFENGVGYLYVDGVLVEQGLGVSNNQYIYMTGIFGCIMTNNVPDVSATNQSYRMAIKSIKFKEL